MMNFAGLEYERSGILLDLRYIPDEVQFKQKARDSSTEIALNYKQPIFANKAKSSTKCENDEFCTQTPRRSVSKSHKNEEFCIKNEELCI